MKKTVTGLAWFGLLAGLMITTAYGQDFQKNYQLNPGGSISISNVSGKISVTGSRNSSLSVVAYREGRDKNVVEIVDQSTPDHVSLKVQYPSGGNYDASVRFVLQVPSGTQYQFNKLSTASGDIEVIDVAGEINVNTASGSITVSQIEGNVNANAASGDVKVAQVHGIVKANAASGDVTVSGVAGLVTANSASGDVNVDLTRIEGNGDLKFSSASGNVTVTAPMDLDAQVSMSTASGSIKSDFPLTIEDLESHGQKAYGRLGGGIVKLSVSTASGDLRLMRK
jgi:DUF4097 and DUF4098 domain-containing protein YvlB